MQITLNKIPFDVRPVDAPLRAALLSDPVIQRGASRPVWAWTQEEGKGAYLVPTTPDKAVALPTGLTVFVPKAGAPLPGQAVQKADGPTAKMAERFLAAVKAKDWNPVLQAVQRVTGIPSRKVPVETFAPLKPFGSYQLRLDTEFQVIELSNAARNLQAFLFLPGLVSFRAILREAPSEGTTLPAIPRTLSVVAPGTKAAVALRRLAVAKRLSEMQADLGGMRPSDLPEADPRRAEIARLGAEWKALQPKGEAPKAA
jgi:hypothetical protein